MPPGECSNIIAALTAALKTDGDSVDTFTVFMTDCKHSALTMGIELPAVPRPREKSEERKPG